MRGIIGAGKFSNNRGVPVLTINDRACGTDWLCRLQRVTACRTRARRTLRR
jgi:hypothetical protein